MKYSEWHSTGMALGEAWQALLLEMRAHEPGVIAGADAEELHQFRVALRKTRALLRLFRRHLPESAALAREFAWLSTALNPARDLDIVAQFVQRTTDQVPLRERASCLRELAQERAQQHKALQTLLRSRRYLRLLNTWQDYIERCLRGVDLPIALYVRVETSQRVIALKQILKLLRRLRRIDADCPSAQLHRLRIRCKRLRYLFDALPADDKENYVEIRKALVQLQALLGEHQDAMVIRAWCERFTDRHPRSMILSQVWYAAVEQQQLHARAGLPSAWRAFIDAAIDI